MFQLRFISERLAYADTNFTNANGAVCVKEIVNFSLLRFFGINHDLCFIQKQEIWQAW
jgi:hypothetical protein